MLVLVCPTEGLTQDGIKRGRAIIYPYISVGSRYDNNVFLDPSDEKHDFITIFHPGLRVDFPLEPGLGKKGLVQFDYNLEAAVFADYSDQDYVNQDLTALFDYTYMDYSFLLKNNFKNTSARAGTEFQDRVERKENDTSLVFGAEYNRLGFETGYKRFMVDYDSYRYEDLDRDDDIATLTGFWRIFPKTRLLLEYKYGKMSYERDATRDGKYNQVRVGMRGQLTDKTTALIKLGYQDRNYDLETEEDWKGGVGFIGLVTKLTDFTTVDFSYERTVVESAYETNNFYATDRASLVLTQRLREKITGSLSLRFETNDYPDETTADDVTQKRSDELWTVGVGLEYQIQEWLKASTGYGYRSSDSNFTDFDYKRGTISVSFSAAF